MIQWFVFRSRRSVIWWILVWRGFDRSLIWKWIFLKGAPQIRNPDPNSPKGTTLRVPVQKLDNGDVLVPGSLLPIFDLKVNGHTNSYIVNNVSRALVDRLTVKSAGKIMQEKSCRKLMVMIYLSSMRTFRPQLVELLVVKLHSRRFSEHC